MGNNAEGERRREGEEGSLASWEREEKFQLLPSFLPVLPPSFSFLFPNRFLSMNARTGVDCKWECTGIQSYLSILCGGVSSEVSVFLCQAQSKYDTASGETTSSAISP